MEKYAGFWYIQWRRSIPWGDDAKIHALLARTLCISHRWRKQTPKMEGWTSLIIRGETGVYVIMNDMRISTTITKERNATYFSSVRVKLF